MAYAMAPMSYRYMVSGRRRCNSLDDGRSWDIMCHDDTALASSEWRKNILAERREKMQSGQAKFITIKDLKAALHSL